MMFHRTRKSGRDARRCVDECEAFLAGRALEVYVANGWPVPDWAQLNWIAHSEPSAITRRFCGERGVDRPAGTWPWATGAIVRELVCVADGDEGTIRLLQRDCLVPMELVLLGGSPRSLLPEHLVALGTPRLRAHPVNDAARRSDTSTDA